MIPELIMAITGALLKFISWILPTWQLPVVVTEAFDTIAEHVMAMNVFIPIEAVVTGLGIIAGFEIAILIAHLIASLVTLIRGGGAVDI